MLSAVLFKIYRFNLKMLLLISDEEESKVIDLFSQNFVVTKQGDFFKIETINPENQSLIFLGYLLFYSSRSTPIFFTFKTIKDLEKYILRPFIFKNPCIHPLWITHKLTMDFVEYLENNYSATIFYYVGEYIPSLTHKSRLRPEFPRKLTYRGADCSDVIREANEVYGINVDKFSFRITGESDIDFDRKIAMFTIKHCDLSVILEITDQFLTQSEVYLNEIRKFKKEAFRTLFIPHDYQFSNNLGITFATLLSDEIVNKIVTLIPEDFEILEQEILKTSKYRMYRLEIFNRSKKGFFRVVLNKKFAHISQIMGANFLGIFPLLDLLDYHQPSNQIQILGH